MCQSSSHWTDYAKFDTGDFHKIVKKPQIWLKSDKNIGHFTRSTKYIYVVESGTKYLLV
jgi:hypothetical protein